jgi:hypothetical protein
VLLTAAPGAAAGSAAAAGSDVDRPVRDGRVSEASGLAVSPQHPGVLWTHDDSGNAPLLFALARDGRVAGTLRLRGTAAVDWEALAAFRDAAGRALLAVGDLGDNRGDRPRVEVDVVAEPGRLGAGAGKGAAGAAPATGGAPLLRLLLTYPDGPADAEALLVDTSRRRMFVVTKGLFGGRVYMVPATGWDGTAPRRATVRSSRLVHVGDVPLGLVTDGTVGPGGAVLLRTYSQIAVFAPFPVEPVDAGLAPLASAALPLQRQGEGLALTPDGRSALLSSEGAGEPVLRVGLTAPVHAALAASGTPGAAAPQATASSSPSLSPSPSAPGGAPAPPAAAAPRSGTDGADDGGRAGSLPWGAVALAAAVVAAIAVASARSRR